MGLLLLFSASVSGNSDQPAQSPSSTDTSAVVAVADALAKAHLPPADQHIFVPVDPAWHTVISYQKLRPDAFVTVDHPTADEMKNFYKEVRYFTFADPHDLNDAVKIVGSYPNGAIYEEIDKLSGAEQYSRSFFLNGRLRNYSHWRSGKWLAGLAVDPETGKPNYFSNGAGSLTTHDEKSGSFKTEWYQDGAIFLTDQFRASKRDEVTLYIANDFLQVRREEEKLDLISQAEAWTLPVGADPQFQIIYDGKGGPVTPKNTDVHALPAAIDGPRQSLEDELKKILREWRVAYPKRRKAFIDRFDQILAQSGQTWKSLNIEFIRNDTAWPTR